MEGSSTRRYHATGQDSLPSDAVSQVDARSLAALGLTRDGLALLLRLLESQTDDVTVSGPEKQQGRALVRLGLATTGSQGRLQPCAPRHALRSYIDGLRSQSDAAKALDRWLAEHHTVHTSPDVEQVVGADAVDAVFQTILDDATTDVRALSIGSNDTGDSVVVAPGTIEALGRGVTFRVVYAAEVLADADVIKVVERCMQTGEEARVFPGIPVNLVIVDDNVGFLMYRGPDRTRRALVIANTPLLRGLSALVDVIWRIAVPMQSPASPDGTGAAVPNDENRQILAYLSAGLTDEAISRELKVSERTVARRISRMQEMLGATGRFQLGVQAVRRGWL